MGLRLKYTYGSLRQNSHTVVSGASTQGWTLEIYDRDYSGVAYSIGKLSPGGVMLSHKYTQKDANKAIIPTVCSWTILMTNAAEELMLLDLVDGDESRFYVHLKHKDIIKFRGFIVVDEVQDQITIGRRELKIKAIDGLTRMKDIQYPIELFTTAHSYPDFNTFGYPTLMEVLARCMIETNINDLYPDLHQLYNVMVEWSASGMAVNDITKPSTWDQVRVANRIFYNLKDEDVELTAVDPKTQSRAMSCYNVLEACLKAFHLKIFYENDSYWIRHAWSPSDENIAMQFQGYFYDGTPNKVILVNENVNVSYIHGNDLLALEPSSVEYTPPHKYVEIGYAGLNEQALNNHVWKETDLGWQGLNYFIQDEEVALNIDFRHIIQKDGSPVYIPNTTWIYEIQIRVGTYYAKRYNNGANLWTCEWVLDDTAFIQYQPLQLIGVDPYESSITYRLDPVPIDGPLEMRLKVVGVFDTDLNTLYSVSNADPAATTGTTFTATGYEGTIHQMIAGLTTQNIDANDDDNYTIYRSGSINGNSKSKTVEVILGNDTETLHAINQIYQWNETASDFLPNAASSPAINWGNDWLLQQKLLESYAQRHSKAKRIINWTLDDVKNKVGMNTYLIYNARKYLPIGYDYITGEDRYTGQWVEVGFPAIAPGEIGEGQTNNPNGVVNGPGFGPLTDTEVENIVATTGVNPNGSIVKSRRYNETTASNLKSILDHTIPSNLKTKYTRKSIEDSYVMYINGVRQQYVPTVAEVTVPGLFTLLPGTINWQVFRAITGRVQLEVFDRLVIETGTTI